MLKILKIYIGEINFCYKVKKKKKNQFFLSLRQNIKNDSSKITCKDIKFWIFLVVQTMLVF